MPLKTYTILLLSVLLSTAAYSHVDFRLYPGYYLDKNGDSVKCQIEFNDWEKTPATIDVEVGGTRKTLSPDDIRGFGVTGYGDYRSVTVNYHTGRITEPGLPEEFSDNKETKTCFLKTIVRGYYSLYELVLPERYCYFLSQQDSSVYELVYRVKLKELTIYEDLLYKVRFSELFVNEGLQSRYQYLITNCTYTGSSLRLLVNRLNEAHTGVKTERVKNKTQPFRLDIFVGATLNTYPSAVSGRFGEPSTMSPGLSPEGGLGVRYIIPSHFQRVALGLSVGYSTIKSTASHSGVSKDALSASWYDLTTYNEQLSFSNTLLVSNLYVTYNFVSKGAVDVYGKAGFDFNLLLKSGGDIYSNYSGMDTGYYSYNPPQPNGPKQGTADVVQMKTKVVSANLGVGIQFDRHRVELLYYTPMELADNVQPTFNLSRFALYYYFTVFK